jgi:uncharacterized membrane protein
MQQVFRAPHILILLFGIFLVKVSFIHEALSFAELLDFSLAEA